MKISIIILVSLLLGCATGPSEKELFTIATECDQNTKVPKIENGIVIIKNGEVVLEQPPGVCDEEWRLWNKADQARLRREREKISLCPLGQIAICNNWCMRDRPSKRVWSCILERTIF